MTQAEADKIIIAKVKAILARGEPHTRLLDDYVKASLLQRHPAIWNFLPRNSETIYNRYIISVDHNTTDELKRYIKKIPGRVNVAMDGATVNGKSKVTIFAFDFLFYANIHSLANISNKIIFVFVTRLYILCQKHSFPSLSLGQTLVATNMSRKLK